MVWAEGRVSGGWGGPRRSRRQLGARGFLGAIHGGRRMAGEGESGHERRKAAAAIGVGVRVGVVVIRVLGEGGVEARRGPAICPRLLPTRRVSIPHALMRLRPHRAARGVEHPRLRRRPRQRNTSFTTRKPSTIPTPSRDTNRPWWRPGTRTGIEPQQPRARDRQRGSPHPVSTTKTQPSPRSLNPPSRHRHFPTNTSMHGLVNAHTNDAT